MAFNKVSTLGNNHGLTPEVYKRQGWFALFFDHQDYITLLRVNVWGITLALTCVKMRCSRVCDFTRCL